MLGLTDKGCILSKFYIKPQLSKQSLKILPSCILSKFYIKPQHWARSSYLLLSCILSKFYIKPQLAPFVTYLLSVVSYRNSTSNHNCWAHVRQCQLLYLIEILHQTTTVLGSNATLVGCILSKFYIKPQLCLPSWREPHELYLIEILHQTTTRTRNMPDDDPVVSYRNSTSNHN